MESGTRRPEAGRSARKRSAILEAAAAVFLQQGYLGTSMDEIAARAAVSKQTVYKHFADKERLFTEVLLGTIGRLHDAFHEVTRSLEDTDDLEADLRKLGRRLVAMITQPRVLQLRRIVIGEAERFPDVARIWYERGPELTAATLGSHFSGLARRGLLRIEDPLLAGHLFIWLVLSIPLNKLMFCGPENPFTEAELDRFADEGVRVFLAAYGTG